MNKLVKIGATALAGSLVAFSVNAAEMSVSGGASITYSNTGAAVTNNNFTMGDSLNFSASGETDGGLNVTYNMEIDNGAEDDHSVVIGGDFGTLTFHGKGGSSALSAIDDMSPNAYEESWDVVSGADTGMINGNAQPNMFHYVTPSINGLTVTATYSRSNGVATGNSNTSTSSFGLSYSPEAVEGLSLGYAMQEDESTAGTAIDETAMYVTYATGPITVGISMSDSDHPTDSSDKEFEAAGITYAVNDDFTIGYNVSKLSTPSNSTDADQDASGVSFSYTMGGMTIAGAVNSVDNANFSSTADRDGAEIGVSFAF
jgi:outer membrane protein OmpU